MPFVFKDIQYATVTFSYLLDMVEKEVTNLDEISSPILLEKFYTMIYIQHTSNEDEQPSDETR